MTLYVHEACDHRKLSLHWYLFNHHGLVYISPNNTGYKTWFMLAFGSVYNNIK